MLLAGLPSDEAKFTPTTWFSLPVIALDFPLEFAGFFPREKSQKTREKSGAFRENSGKKSRFSPRYSAPKRHSILFLQTFLCINTHVPPRQGFPARPTPTRPAPTRPVRPHPARPPPPGPPPPGQLRPAPPPNFSLSTDFFQGATGFFPRAGTGIFPRAGTHLLR